METAARVYIWILVHPVPWQLQAVPMEPTQTDATGQLGLGGGEAVRTVEGVKYVRW